MVLGRLVGGLGALLEREYRFLFAATLVTSLGDGVALMTLAFAIFDVATATGLGVVRGVRQLASGAVLVLGDVVERVPLLRGV